MRQHNAKSATSQLRTATRPGAVRLPGGSVDFHVWAPRCARVALRLADAPDVPMLPMGAGWFKMSLDGVPRGARYRWVLDGARARPDPASRAQPDGVHGASELIDPAEFRWTDGHWRGVPLAELVLYELHVGTFTPRGTFDAVIPRLSALCDLGVTALQLMPVASFPGVRNWGYDGVGLFAPQHSYGGPDALRRLVDACHAHGLAVFLDVVYNHLGPEGNYLAEFGPYFTDRYRTPWGTAINFDGPDAGPVRDFFIANACHWISEYHLDGLRLDAIHGVFDQSPVHILQEINDHVQALATERQYPALLIAESDLNDRRVVEDRVRGGHGLAAQWSDDFHHAVHSLLTGEETGYYEDFGSTEHLMKALTKTFVYDGCVSRHRGRPHGTPVADLPTTRFVVFTQNHDQVGNRARGERLAHLVGLDAAKLAASTVILSPYLPLLFMGEEYGETAPFLYFTDFTDAALRKAVSRGRREEFAAFQWQEDIPDPEDPETFARSQLHWELRDAAGHAPLLRFYRRLLALRRTHPALAPHRDGVQVLQLDERTLAVVREARTGEAVLHLQRFSPRDAMVRVPVLPGAWRRVLDAGDEEFGGAGLLAPPQLVSADWEVSLGPFGCVVYACGNARACGPVERPLPGDDG